MHVYLYHLNIPASDEMTWSMQQPNMSGESFYKTIIHPAFSDEWLLKVKYRKIIWNIVSGEKKTRMLIEVLKQYDWMGYLPSRIKEINVVYNY